jgi:glycosyltransferase involved in cell wall biosynthesis
MNLIIVPSEFTKQGFLNTGQVNTDIVVIPESFIEEVKTPNDCTIDLDLPTDFNLLVFGQITGNNPDNDRKNLAYTVKWLSECLADKPNVGVILKTNMARNTKIDRTQCVNVLTKLVAEVKKGPGPKFHLLHGNMTNSEVVGLYTHPKVKALVSLTHGEGYGLPILEAAASGLPVITPGWSGHMDFLKHGKFIKVDHKVAPIHESRVDNQIFMPGAQWAYPQEQDVKRKVLKFLESPSVPRDWAKELRETLLPLYNFETISAQYDNILLSHLVGNG